MILARFRRNSPSNRTIHALYGIIVAQARSVAFYADYRVPDTVEGRFDLIVLHLGAAVAPAGARRRRGTQPRAGAFRRVLPRSRCQSAGNGGRRPCRAEAHAAFGEAFYGRQAAYLAALDAADERVFEKALARNIFQADGTTPGAAQLARYARAALTRLDAQETGRPHCAARSSFRTPRLLHMSEHKADKRGRRPGMFRSRSRTLPKTGQHFDLVADEDVRAAVARLAGLRDLPRLEANFDVTRHGAAVCASRASFGDGWPKLRRHAWNRSPTKSRRTSISSSCRRRRASASGDRGRSRRFPNAERKLEWAGAAHRRRRRSWRAGDRVPHPWARSLSAQAGRGIRAAAGS